MKSISFRKLLLSCLLALGAVTPAPAANNASVEINHRDTRAEIRTQLLKYTPVGCSSKEVVAFLKTRLLKKGDPEPIIRNHGATGPSAEASSTKGVKSIKLDLGDYLESPILLTLSPPLPFREALMAQWAFDANDKLVGLFLDRKLEP